MVTLADSAFLMWRRRRPEGALGAPALPRDPAKTRGVAAIVLLLAALLPLLGASLILLWFADRLILPRLPRAARWRGLAQTRSDENTSELPSLLRIYSAGFCIDNNRT